LACLISHGCLGSHIECMKEVICMAPLALQATRPGNKFLHCIACLEPATFLCRSMTVAVGARLHAFCVLVHVRRQTALAVRSTVPLAVPFNVQSTITVKDRTGRSESNSDSQLVHTRAIRLGRAMHWPMLNAAHVVLSEGSISRAERVLL
jgi:hypothetical protein